MNFDSNRFQFGVEIEFTGIPANRAFSVLAQAVDGNKKHSVYSEYDLRLSVSDAEGRIWKIVHDKSIYAQRQIKGKPTSGVISKNEKKYQLELVTPVLRYEKDMPTLMKIAADLKAANAIVNTSTGLHIHVFAGSDFNPQSLLNLVNIYFSKQDLLLKALSVSQPRLVYCGKLSEDLVKRLNNAKPRTFRQFADEYYKDYGGYDANIDMHYSRARYLGLNLHSFFENQTVEFRLFNSTLEADEIKTDVLLALAICSQALYQTKTSYRVTQTDNEAYSFRTFLLRLGFIGEEFRTARKILLKNLDGNPSWRNGIPTNGTQPAAVGKGDDNNV